MNIRNARVIDLDSGNISEPRDIITDGKSPMQRQDTGDIFTAGPGYN